VAGSREFLDKQSVLLASQEGLCSVEFVICIWPVVVKVESFMSRGRKYNL
jgi:hypothetical protein